MGAVALWEEATLGRDGAGLLGSLLGLAGLFKPPCTAGLAGAVLRGALLLGTGAGRLAVAADAAPKAPLLPLLPLCCECGGGLRAGCAARGLPLLCRVLPLPTLLVPVC